MKNPSFSKKPEETAGAGSGAPDCGAGNPPDSTAGAEPLKAGNPQDKKCGAAPVNRVTPTQSSPRMGAAFPAVGRREVLHGLGPVNLVRYQNHPPGTFSLSR